MSKPKLLILSPRPPWREGGVERVVAEVSQRIQNDFDTTVYSTDQKNGVHRWKGIPVYVFRGYSNAYHFSPILYRAVKNKMFDLIHAHGFTTFMPLVASLTGDHIVFNPYFHISGSSQVYEKARKFYDRIFGNYLFSRADCVICSSKTEQHAIEQRFRVNGGKTKVIPNGVDISKTREAQPFHLNKKIVLYVGRLEQYKNVHLVVEAMKHLPGEYLLCIVGEGNYHCNLRMLVNKLGLTERVRFLGYVTDYTLRRWLKTCSVLVNLSEMESFGMTCIEALAAEKPVVVNDDNFGLSETADMFRGKGVVKIRIKETSIPEISKSIIESTNLKVDVDLDEFDWDNIAMKFAEVYSRTLNHRPSQD